MVDFRKHINKSPSAGFQDPITIHEHLDTHVSHSHLRDVQREALENFIQIRDKRDIVIKMSTGSGKTTIGLLILKSYINELNGPAIYLSPTLQLVDQVIEEAEKLGLKATAFTSTDLEPSAIQGEKIIVATYDKLFNAKSVFEREHIRPVAIVLDDAHTGIERIRNNFTPTWKKGDRLYKFFINLFEDALKQQNLAKTKEIFSNNFRTILEVPYWSWYNQLELVSETLAKSSITDDSLTFKWNFIRDSLESINCLISGIDMALSPDILDFRSIPTYQLAEHRIFMSATLADDSVLVRDMDCDPSAALSPLQPKTDRGMGERMVLVPSLFDPSFNRDSLVDWVKKASTRYNVVILTSTIKRANMWKSEGAKFAKGNDVSRMVERLRDKKENFVVFANRYDGIDLPDDACRILVMDGLPSGDTLRDAMERDISENHINKWLVHRIEQGMGRVVRSPSDYAVIILYGRDLVTFIAHSEYLSLMNKETQAQIRLAHELTRLANDDYEEKSAYRVIADLALQCLRRDEGWKEFYHQEVVDKEFTSSERGRFETHIKLAALERKAFNHYLAGDYQEAYNVLVNAADTLASGNIEKGILFQRAGKYFYPENPDRAFELQKKAKEWNHKLLKAPQGITYQRKSPSSVTQADLVLRWYGRFEHGNGAVAAIQQIRDLLSYSSDSETFEQALLELGEILGAQSERPEREYGKGPDNLWVFAKYGFVIEAKNTSLADVVPKIDGIGQLHDSIEWGKKHYPDLICVGIICHRAERADPKSNPSSEMYLIAPVLMESLISGLEQFIIKINRLSPVERTQTRVNEIITASGIYPEAFLSKYTERLHNK